MRIAALVAAVAVCSLLPVEGKQAPGVIYRARVTMIGTKMIMGVRYRPQPDVFDVYNFRVRWAGPFHWHDSGAKAKLAAGTSAKAAVERPGDVHGRHYSLHCWLKTADGKNFKTLFRRRMNWQYNGYEEKLRFPPALDVTVQCSVSATNKWGMSTEVKYTNAIRVQDIPIYLPGLEGINLRGLDAADVTAVLGKIAKAQALADQRDDADTQRAATRRTTQRATTTRATAELPTTATTGAARLSTMRTSTGAAATGGTETTTRLATSTVQSGETTQLPPRRNGRVPSWIESPSRKKDTGAAAVRLAAPGGAVGFDSPIRISPGDTAFGVSEEKEMSMGERQLRRRYLRYRMNQRG